jgi:hypothetical protein
MRTILKKIPFRLLAGFGLFALASMILIGVVIWRREHPTAAELCISVDRDVKVILAKLANASTQDMITELKDAERRLSSRCRALQHGLARIRLEPKDSKVMKKMAHINVLANQLLKQIQNWKQHLDAVGGVDIEISQTIKIAVLNERLNWSAAPVSLTKVPRFRPREVWQASYGGALSACRWPWQIVKAILGLGSTKFGILRRIFYPFSSLGTLPFVRLIGYAFSGTFFGFCFCWIGAKWNSAALGYIGLGYFVNMLVYTFGTLFMYMGLIT